MQEEAFQLTNKQPLIFSQSNYHLTQNNKNIIPLQAQCFQLFTSFKIWTDAGWFAPSNLSCIFFLTLAQKYLKGKSLVFLEGKHVS